MADKKYTVEEWEKPRAIRDNEREGLKMMGAPSTYMPLDEEHLASMKRNASRLDELNKIDSRIESRRNKMIQSREVNEEKTNKIERDDIIPVQKETKGRQLDRNRDVTDKTTALETTSNSERASETMVEVAAARGWKNIKVSGSAEFKKQAWEAAAEKGMEVRGYEPTEPEKVKVLNKVLSKEFVDNPVKAVKEHPELKISHRAMEVIIEKAKNDGLDKEQMDYVSQRVKLNIANTISQGRTSNIKSFEKEIER